MLLDIAFGDSDALWAHHSSGTFSQIDLRNCTKPLDAITRTPMSWEASGSLAFVTELDKNWQIPYDDMYDISSSCLHSVLMLHGCTVLLTNDILRKSFR